MIICRHYLVPSKVLIYSSSLSSVTKLSHSDSHYSSEQAQGPNGIGNLYSLLGHIYRVHLCHTTHSFRVTICFEGQVWWLRRGNEICQETQCLSRVIPFAEEISLSHMTLSAIRILLMDCNHGAWDVYSLATSIIGLSCKRFGWSWDMRPRSMSTSWSIANWNTCFIHDGVMAYCNPFCNFSRGQWGGIPISITKSSKLISRRWPVGIFVHIWEMNVSIWLTPMCTYAWINDT